MKPLFSLAFLLFASSLCVHAQTALTTGTPIAAELKANEKHSYQLTLTNNQTAYLVVTQLGVDVQTNVFDTAGKMTLEMDTPFGGSGKEATWIIDQPAGVYRLELSTVLAANGRMTSGKYEIKLVELRAAVAADSQRQQAQDAWLAARKLWRSINPADRKAAILKLDEAARLLENDPENELRTVVDNRLFQLAPMLKVERMKLAKTPGMVTTYHSADLAKETANKRALLESLLNFYQPLLKQKFELNYALLNKDDWKRVCPVCPYTVPVVTWQEPIAFIESNDTQAIKGMLAMYKNKMPASLNSALAAEGLSYETVTPVILDAAGYFYLVGALRNQSLARLPKSWMNAVIETYLMYAWLNEKQPALLKQIKLGMQVPGAVLTPSARTLDTMFGNNDPFTGGVALSRASELAAALYDKHQLGLLIELQKAFPKGTPVDAATAEQRFVALSPLIKPWIESFSYTGAALEVRQAEEALVAARKAKDGAAVDRLLTSNYAGLNQFGQQRDFSGFRMSATSTTPVAVFNLDRTDIEIIGDLAIVRGAQTEQWEGGPLEHHLFTRIWVKRDGRWQLQSNTQFIDPNKR